VNGELLIFRPQAWNRFGGDIERYCEVSVLLSENEVPMFPVNRSYRSPVDYRSALGTGPYGEASPEAAAAQNHLKEAGEQWLVHAGGRWGIANATVAAGLSARGRVLKGKVLLVPAVSIFLAGKN